ncbi:isoprenoid synthase domain-containing protein [Apodospora peruviana]|uniref:Terpene synthase n=1 Tax=Apodospora peruviana TaxID=516989 RepID=A0AAE0HZE4_9PEZI|nr:isoprenoid synthase domain-containing protein [Apodospora peruviana]
MGSMATNTTEMEAMSAKLRGQKLHIPDLRPIYNQWPTKCSPHYAQLKVTVELKIKEWIPAEDEKMRQSARKIDVAMFSAVWYPGCALDRLETMAWYTMWIVLWDDDIEDTVDLPKLRGIHNQALKYVAWCLGLEGEETTSPTKYCSLFQYCGAPLKAACTVAELKRLYQEIERYMRGCEEEATYVVSGKIPDEKTYWAHRLGSSSCDTYNALGEYMCGNTIPEELFEKPQMSDMWTELNKQIVCLNDLVSLKNEVARNWCGMVPIIMKEDASDSLEDAVATVVESIRKCGEIVERSAKELVAMAPDDDQKKNVENYVYVFLTNMSGNYWWS